jgi:hypothetical protein
MRTPPFPSSPGPPNLPPPGQVLLPDAQFPRTSSPHTAGSRLRMARLSDGAATPAAAASLSRAVPPGGGLVEFPGLSVAGATAPPLFLAFHACGALALWNRHWRDGGGRPQAQETALLPPSGTRGERAGMGDYWMGGQAAGAFDDNGFALGDQAYLTQVRVGPAGPLPGGGAAEGRRQPGRRRAPPSRGGARRRASAARRRAPRCPWCLVRGGRAISRMLEFK